MLHYLINTSIIWLACLVLYDVWLKRESFHQFNRLYLLLSVVIGLLLPKVNLLGWLSSSVYLPPPIAQVYPMKQALQEMPNLPSTDSLASIEFNIQSVIIAIYLLGVLVGLLLFISEVINLFRLYQLGHKNRDQDCTIVETGKEQGVFSFLKIIFVGNRNDYSTEQWNWLLMHEKEHHRQLHAVDNLLFIILRILFWFHPLPYIYYRKLRIVHEFQADQAASNNTLDYGQFLLEQNLLQGAPMLAHSFNYSPIKIRIAMLTKTKSSPIHRLKYLTVLPLFFFFLLFCTQTSYSGESLLTGENPSTTKKSSFKGNEIAFREFKVVPFEHIQILQQQQQMFLFTSIPDSFPVTNRATNELIRMEATGVDIMPIAVNGKPIFGKEKQYLHPVADMNYTEPIFIGAEKNLEHHLFLKIKDELDKLEDGSYVFRLNRMVIDDKGSIAYCENPGVDLWWSKNESMVINDLLKQRMEEVMMEALDKPLQFKPAIKDGQPVNVRLKIDGYEIEVKNHQASLRVRSGC